MPTGPTFGGLGNSLDDAVRTEFFSWFELIEDGSETSLDGTAVTHFRSRGGEYRRFATCTINTRADRLMDRIALTVDGTFIDSPEIWQLARDITRSFIAGAVTHESDVGQVQEIIRDLLHRPHVGAKPPPASPEEIKAAIYRGERTIVRRGIRGDKPKLPAVVSRGFAVYTGEREEFIRNLTTTRFTMQNYVLNSRRTLEVAFERITSEWLAILHKYQSYRE